MASAQGYVHQPVVPKHPYQDKYIDAVVKGDLKAFKDLRVPTRDVSRQLFLPDDLRPKPKYHPRGRPILIRRPTLLQFAVICEQDEIVRYILDHKEPDLSVRAGDNRNVLHVAAAVKDYRPLQILLQYRWIQEHIDEELKLPGQPSRDGLFNTALHIAVTNQNIPHVFLLISELPAFHVVPRAVKAVKAADEAEDPSVSEKINPANPDQRSAGGSAPLHIAVQQQNLAIVRILCAFGADQTATNDDSETPLNLAEKIKAKRDEALEARRKRLEDEGKPYTPPDAKSDIDLIVKILKSSPNDSADDLRQELAPELIPKVVISGATGIDEEEGGETGGKGKGSAKLDELYRLMKGFDRRLQALEERVAQGGVAAAGGAGFPAAAGLLCSVCQAPGKPCNTCHLPFCATCDEKPAHTCTT